MSTELLESPLVGRSTLAGPFRSSRGFAVMFHGTGLTELTARWPALGAWLPGILGAPAVEALRPWYRRRLTPPNTWYLNLLLVTPGAMVGRHIDATLAPLIEETLTPVVVSVLYLRVPPGPGGELQLWRDAEPVARLRPRENRLLHFRGDLAHQVEPFSAADTLRASLVVEQYTLTPEQQARVPAFKVDSRAGFGAFLETHERRAEPRQFEREP